MVIWGFIVALGLLLTLAGILISFWINPPIVRTLPSIEEHAEQQRVFLEKLSRGEIKPAPLKKTEPMITKTEWSKLGIGLLLAGTILQFIGTVCQVIRLTYRG